MLLFWSLVALLIAVTLVVLLVPLLKHRHASEGPDPDAATTAVYRDQKQALEAEYADGVITGEEREAAVAELSHRLGEEVGHATKPRPPAFKSKSAWILAAALLLVIPSAAVVLYARLGKPEAIVAAPTEGSAHELSDRQVAALVDTLAQRLKTQPDDAEGWVLLARSYNALGRFPEAADAYAHATALIPGNADLLADYADALAMAQGRKLAGKPAELAAKALTIDPNHKKSLALAATAAMEARDIAGAIALWQRLRAQFPEGSDDAKQTTAIIAEVEGMKADSKAPGSSVAAAKPVAPPPPAAAAPATPPRVAAARAPAAATPSSGPAIAGRVDIAPNLAGKVALNDTVFIFARAADGPRMPLAALRVEAKQLPMDFRLDDSMGMGGGPKLSGAPSVIIEARISKSGNAMPQAGDLSGRSAAVTPGASGVNVTIDQVVP
jgi:cytochrome c-type biogenesis protein CcmH